MILARTTSRLDGSPPAAIRHSQGFTLVEIMIVVAIIGLLAAIAIPNFVRARARAQAAATLEEVKLIDSAKGQFALENSKSGTYTPKVAELRPYLKPGSRLYNTTQLSNFRDMFSNIIQMGDINTAPVIADTTRDLFTNAIPDTATFWGVYAN